MVDQRFCSHGVPAGSPCVACYLVQPTSAISPQPLTAICGYCGAPLPRGQLREAPMGGAVCKDWFECQRRRDQATRPGPRRRRPA